LTLKIEAVRHGETVTVRLVGRLAAAYLDELRAQIVSHDASLVLDLDQVTLVDVAVVRFLIACEAAGIELRNCAPYIREWMERERKGGGDVPKSGMED
jgi:anti-anti-sigma regulatory factor